MIRYYIPSDGDDPQHPNIFHLPSNISQPTLRDVRQHFPLPGSYHFRFKKKLGDTKVVWLDVIEDSAAIPNYEGIILAKVSRISMDGAKPTAAGNNVPTRSSGMRSQEHHSASSPATSEGSTTADLLNMGISSSPIRSSPASSSGGGTRQQASQPPPRPTASSPSIHQAPETDPFGLFASSSSSSMSQGRTTPPLGSSSPGIGGGGPPDLLNFDAFGAPRGSSMAGMGRGMPPPNMARGPSPMGGGVRPPYPPPSQQQGGGAGGWNASF